MPDADIDRITAGLVSLEDFEQGQAPSRKLRRYGLNDDDASVDTDEYQLAIFFDAEVIANECGPHLNGQRGLPCSESSGGKV